MGQWAKDSLIAAIERNEAGMVWEVMAPVLGGISGALSELMQISRVCFDQKVPAAAITDEGNNCVIMLNRGFLESRVESPSDMAALLLHEILHHALGHLNSEDRSLAANIAQDAVVNALIHQLNPGLSGFFARIIEPTHPVAMMLRPGSVFHDPDNQKLYDRLYQGQVGELEVWAWLTGKLDSVPSELKPLLAMMAAHGYRRRSRIAGRARKRFDDLLRACRRTLGEKGGWCQSLDIYETWVEPEDSQEAEKRRLEKIMKNLLQKEIEKYIIKSASQGLQLKRPLAVGSRRDITMLAAGVEPVLYSWPMLENYEEETAGQIQVYVDVSGSVTEEIPWIYGLLVSVERFLKKPIKLFSTEIEPITLGQLAKGEVYSTGGTDYDCVARDILENKVKKALILTDGFADLSAGLVEKIKRNKVDITSVYITEDYFQQTPLIKVSNKIFIMTKNKRRR